MDALIYQELVNIIREGRDGVLITIVSATPGTPRKTGARMILSEDGSILGTIGGGGLEHLILKEAKNVFSSKESILKHYDLTSEEGGIGAVCGGAVDIFIEPIQKATELFIFGGGHVGMAIYKIAKILYYKVHIIDDREKFCNRERFPEADGLWCGNYDKMGGTIPLKENSYVIVLTRAWKTDEQALRVLLPKKFKYLGVIGSNKKITTHKDSFEDLKLTQEDWVKVYAPIGLPIGGYAPEEIAISIVAEIIAIEKGTRQNFPGWQNV